ncbi:MAG: DUF2171 domain-containing protein [Anaerolineales bacterium]|nr:DUF2171 domain-containing protein [Anaerolineales bacterium]
MKQSEISCHHYVTSCRQSETMMIQGTIPLARADGVPVEVQRGMHVVTSDAMTIGMVAALVLDAHCQEVTHLLLCRLPETAVYRHIPLDLIIEVDAEAIHLNIQANMLETLPIHQPNTLHN